MLGYLENELKMAQIMHYLVRQLISKIQMSHLTLDRPLGQQKTLPATKYLL